MQRSDTSSPRRNKRNIALLLLFVFLTGSEACAGAKIKEPRRLTNPLLQHIYFKELRPFRRKIEELIKKKIEARDIEEAAGYFRSLADGIWIGISGLHDIGVVYYEDNPCILGVMTRGNDFDEFSGVVRDISAL